MLFSTPLILFQVLFSRTRGGYLFGSIDARG